MATPNTNPSSSNTNGTPTVRLLSDPNLAVCPDFASDTFADLRKAINGGADDAAAIDMLKLSWVKGNDKDKAQWTIQVAGDQAAADAEELRLQQEADAAKDAAEKVAEQERLDAEKKLPKLGDFSETSGPSVFVEARISAFAQKKLERREYCPLWPFTTAGLNEAAAAVISSSEDASAITLDRSSDDHLTVRSGPSSATHKNMVRDQDLTYREFSLGSHRYIKEIRRLGWPEKHVQAQSQFFYALDTHSIREQSKEHGDKIVLIYADRYRLEWFQTLGIPGQSFNLAQISPEHLNQVSNDYFRKLHAQTIDSTS
ncbi:hypothetical protein C8R46DRAFT_923899 [Mycena filopes]|nr:hypothetical protein C8R46DRAFT_923899 [Mycena filopes]